MRALLYLLAHCFLFACSALHNIPEGGGVGKPIYHATLLYILCTCP